MDTPIVRQTLSNNVFGQAQYYHQDGLGSIVGISNSSDTTTQTQRFDAWGNKLAGTIPQSAQYGYTGREPDETGIVYYRARYYDPTMGRFVSRDPIGLSGGINQYTYVNDNPINYTDPDGLLAKQAVNTVSAYWGQASDWASNATVADVFPGLAPIGQGLGAGAAWLVGTTTGNEGLSNAGYQGLVEHKADIANSVVMFATVGRGGAKGGSKSGEFSISDWTGYPAGIPSRLLKNQHIERQLFSSE